ncbi:MAG TPA: hypothetical protein VFY40_04295 [Blastocatellia bacterium]|nr:hypothetical protein [Blastocatellia bacterium]
MRYQRRIGQFNVVAECAEDLEEQAIGLLTKLDELNKVGPAIQDGTTIMFGWSLLTLRGDVDELVICEPDFERDPFHDSLPQVEHTLRILIQQVALLKLIGAEGLEARFQDKVVIAKGALGTERIYLDRTATDADSDSGWFIGEVEGRKSKYTVEELEAIYVYQIFQIRRALMKVLALPPGYMVVFRGDNIEAIFDADTLVCSGLPPESG